MRKIWSWMFLVFVSFVAIWVFYRFLNERRQLNEDYRKAVESTKVESSAPTYDSSHDLIWTSMVPGKFYLRDSPSKAGGIEYLQRDDRTSIAVPAPAEGSVTSIKTVREDYLAVIFSNKEGKLYYYHLGFRAVEMGQKVAKGDILGYRPGVVRLGVRLTGPDGKPVPLASLLPPVERFPADADKF